MRTDKLTHELFTIGMISASVDTTIEKLYCVKIAEIQSVDYQKHKVIS